MMNSSSRKICVVGGAGAIGSRLVQKLVSQGHEVIVIVRSLSSAIRIGRLDINIIVLDLLEDNTDRLLAVLAGVDTVIDCSFVSGIDCDEIVRDSQKIAQKLKQAAVDARVKHIIHYGTISVYPATGETISEDTPCDFSGDPYGDGKLAAERCFLEADIDVPVTILQLPIVFGPFMNWSASVATQLANSTLLVPDSFKGWCTPIFIDDVVDATELAMSRPLGGNKKLLLCGGNIQWQDYYQAYANLSDSLDLELIDRPIYDRLISDQNKKHQPFGRLKETFANDGDFRQLILAQFGFRHIYGLVKRYRGQTGIDKIKASITDDSAHEAKNKVLLSGSQTKLYDSLPKINSNQAGEVLGFQPREFHEGMVQTEVWLRWSGLLVD